MATIIHFDDATISAMALACSADPVADWMYPDACQFVTHYPTFVRLYADVEPLRAWR